MYPNQAQSKEFLRSYFQPPPPLPMPITSNQSVHQGSGGFFGAIKQSASSQNCFSPTATTNQEPRPPPIYHGFFGAPAPPVKQSASSQNCFSPTTPTQEQRPLPISQMQSPPRPPLVPPSPQPIILGPVKQSASSQNNFSPTTPTQEPRPMPPPPLMQQCPPPINHLVLPPPLMSISSHRPHKAPSIQEYYPPSAAHNNDDATNIDDYYENYDEYYESYEDNQQGEYRGRREEKLARRTRTYFCDICSIQCVGEQAWQSHLDGKNHKKKLNNSQQGTSSATANGQKPAYHCEICNIDCTGADSYKTHINGQKHQKAIKLLIKVNKPIPTTEISMIMPTDGPATSGGSEEGQQSQPNNKSRKRTLADSLGDNPNKIPLLNANAPELINDNYIAEKIGQIELNEEQKAKLEEFVLLVERTLLKVSNQVELNRPKAQPANFPPDPEGATPKLLRGIMRVGLLANQLLLKSDRQANLVILCSEIPTIDLLKQTADLFRRNINEETWRNQNLAANEYSIVEMISESAFRVSRAGIGISIFVTLSCLAMRQWSPGDLNYHPYQRPPNALPEIPCLNALAEMRRTKFYQAKFQQFTSMNWTVKIVRDFGYRAMQEKWGDRVPAWSRLSDWMIILIVEKAISMYSAQTASPSVALKSLFNAISDGHIFGSLQNDFVAQLPDPCEKQFTDSIASLTASERKNIWASTNYSLKQMNKNNLAGLLALEGTDGGSKNHHHYERKKKRPNSSAGIGDGAQQKEGPSAEHNNSSRSEQLKPKHGKTNWNGRPMN